MTNTANISFRDSDQDIWEWMEDMHKNGPYRNRSHVVVQALKEKMERGGDDRELT